MINKNDSNRYARLIGYVDTEDEYDLEMIKATVVNYPHIEWANEYKAMYYIYLTKEQYDRQDSLPNRGWTCPYTGLGDRFDDQWFEEQHILE